MFIGVGPCKEQQNKNEKNTCGGEFSTAVNDSETLHEGALLMGMTNMATGSTGNPTRGGAGCVLRMSTSICAAPLAPAVPTAQNVTL
jgi:hypothetical protein